MQVDHENNLKNILWNDSFNYDGTTYGIWLFGDGEFTNKGDGGYPNWSFSGWFDRASDNHQKILFRTPGAKGTYSESIC